MGDTAGHKMEVLLDNGLYRHLKFTNNGSSVYRFDIHTWPGFLCVCGDMGTYVFQRLEDMFKFFRSNDAPLRINPHYWAEKCQAHGNEDVERYDPDAFAARIKEWMEDGEFSEEVKTKVREEVLSCAEEGEYSAMKAAIDFEVDGRQVFQDFWECNLKTWTFNFLWICYAIVWGIQQYDGRTQ